MWRHAVAVVVCLHTHLYAASRASSINCGTALQSAGPCAHLQDTHDCSHADCRNTQPPEHPNASLAQNSARHCPCPPQVHGRAYAPGPSGGLWVAASALAVVARALRALPSAPPLRRPSAACMQVEAISVRAPPPHSDMPRRTGPGAEGHTGGIALVSSCRRPTRPALLGACSAVLCSAPAKLAYSAELWSGWAAHSSDAGRMSEWGGRAGPG